MKILVRPEKAKHWEVAESVVATAEAELQHLLAEDPSLIPVDEIRDGVSPLVVAVREFGLPGSGNTDVLALTADGDIAVIECKLAVNPESKRKVIGQTFEYAAYLWGMTYDDFDRRVAARRGKGVSELVQEVVPDDFDGAAFRGAVEQSLSDGAFILVIVVDKVNEELGRTIRYVNACSSSKFSLHALELTRFKANGLELLVPQLHGASAPPPERRVEPWTPERFFSALDQSVAPDVRQRVERLYNWSLHTADRVPFGRGSENGSFTFHYLREGRTVSVFSVYTYGRMQFNFGGLSPQLPAGVLQEFYRRLTDMVSSKLLPPDFSKYPNVPVEKVLPSDEELEKLEQTVEWLRGQLEGEASS